MIHRQLPAPPIAEVSLLPPGWRIYAIGDVHGRLDLLDRLLAYIRADDRARSRSHTVVLFLGDLIDRGPQSAAVVARVMGGLSWAASVCLMGNHEAAMIEALSGDGDAARMWLRYGGIEALLSWGVPRDVLNHADAAEIIDVARTRVPEAHRRWIAGLPVYYRVGCYYFVHAGIRPGVELDQQVADDQLWIRDEFLASRRDHGAIIVHGHTIVPAVEDLRNRIGVDTGAYRNGRLSAVGLEASCRWFVEADDGSVNLLLTRGG